jgi:hypothetical protein
VFTWIVGFKVDAMIIFINVAEGFGLQVFESKSATRTAAGRET